MKNAYPIISAIIIGICFSKFMFNQYNYDSKLSTVFSNGTSVYFLQQGVYSSKETMEQNCSSFPHYIYTIDSDKYYVYVAITKSSENLEKLKGYYYNLGYSIYVKELNISNNDFINILEQYDVLLSKSTENSVIEAITTQTLLKYEELIK